MELTPQGAALQNTMELLQSMGWNTPMPSTVARLGGQDTVAAPMQSGGSGASSSSSSPTSALSGAGSGISSLLKALPGTPNSPMSRPMQNPVLAPSTFKPVAPVMSLPSMVNAPPPSIGTGPYTPPPIGPMSSLPLQTNPMPQSTGFAPVAPGGRAAFAGGGGTLVPPLSQPQPVPQMQTIAPNAGADTQPYFTSPGSGMPMAPQPVASAPVAVTQQGVDLGMNPGMDPAANSMMMPSFGGNISNGFGLGGTGGFDLGSLGFGGLF